MRFWPTVAARGRTFATASHRHWARRFVQPELARTLEALAAEGTESFYRGSIAGALAQGCQEVGGAKVEAGRMELEVGEFSLPEALENSLTMVRERASRHGITLGLEAPQSLASSRRMSVR